MNRYMGFRKDSPASSCPGPDGKCLEMASIPSTIAPDKTRGFSDPQCSTLVAPKLVSRIFESFLGGRRSENCCTAGGNYAAF